MQPSAALDTAAAPAAPPTRGDAGAASDRPTDAGQAGAAQPGGRWWYLDAQGQHVGPFTTDQLQAYHVSGYVPSETLVWAEGRGEWQSLGSVPELAKVFAAISDAAAAGTTSSTLTEVRQTANAVESAGAAATDLGAATQRAAGKVATVRAAPVQHDPMAAFTAEISAIEAEQEQQAAEPPPSPEDKRFVDDDGTAYEWDSTARRFVEVGTQSAAAPQYNQEDMTFAVEAEEIPAIPEPEEAGNSSGDEGLEGSNGGKGRHKPDKRKLAEAIEREQAKKAKAKADAEQAAWHELKQISSVYVTGLPADATEAELVKVFTKCGVIKLDDDRRPRVKVYRDADGVGKGDGLVTYLKPPSVALAIQIIDGTPLRDGESQKMSVTEAKFEQKGEYNAKKKTANKKRKKKVLEKQEEVELGWGGFDDVAPATKTMVVLRHMFSPEEFLQDFTLREQLEDDVMGEASKLGRVEKLKVFHTNPEGIVTVRFREEDAAQQCIALMHGRFFGGRQLQAALWDGVEQFFVKPAKRQETAEEEQARLEKFAEELEAGSSEPAPPA